MKAFGIANIVLASVYCFFNIRQLIKTGESDLFVAIMYLACSICLAIVS